ncbi:MAG: GNAT family N-acetyltransferase [Rhodocyclaceae bacterium]|nr:GNAT family N-acetyltransferase [Rhodocyclaceae bacterium]
MSLDEVRCELGSWAELGTEAHTIRTVVFVGEQGVAAELEVDGRDGPSLHVLVRDPSGRAIATGRLLPDGHVGRMAVLAEARGQGVGAMALKALVDAARRRGDPVLRLNAQKDAVRFYERHGFRPAGEPFMEAGIRHHPMSLDLEGLQDLA